MTLHIDLAERVAIVTGAASGIGHATMVRLLDAGCTVIANARRETPEIKDRFSALESCHAGRLQVCWGSVTEPTLPRSLAATVKASGGRLDILVNNAGILRDNLIGLIPDQEIDDVLDVNVAAVLRLTQFAARQMGSRRSGSIVNLSSIIGRRGNAGQFVYGASKAAVIGATLASSKELAPKGIRVNAVAPGLIDTPMIQAIPQVGRSRLEAGIGMQRLGTAEDVADVILYLASDLSAYVTGQVIGVDGGLVL